MRFIKLPLTACDREIMISDVHRLWGDARQQAKCAFPMWMLNCIRQILNCKSRTPNPFVAGLEILPTEARRIAKGKLCREMRE